MITKIRTVIVDDELLARENLLSLLSEHCPNVLVVGEAAKLESAEILINELNPDLVLLDIRLSNSTSFELLEQLKTRDFGVIFITAYDGYAMRAIKFSAVDYILKPINPLELVEAVKKYSRKIETDRKSIQLELLIENLSKERAFNRLAVNYEDRIEMLLVKQILRMQGESNYTRIFLEGNRSMLVSKSLIEFEDLLIDLGFLRVHKTHLVNIHHIKSFKKYGEFQLLLSDETTVPVSRRRKSKVVESLSIFNKSRRDGK